MTDSMHPADGHCACKAQDVDYVLPQKFFELLPFLLSAEYFDLEAMAKRLGAVAMYAR